MMLRGKPNKRYTPEFKKLVVETMMKEKLGYRETARRFEVRGAQQIINWERIYLAEGPEGLAIERRGHGSSKPRKLPKEGEEDLLYLQEFHSMEHFKQELIEYLDYYNNRRIKAKLKGLPPAIHRQQALSVA
mgnify:CR=1 FL=1